MNLNYTAVIKQDGDWWIGWIEEIPGVNSQGTTREELEENLRSALKEALEMNRVDALTAAEGDYQEIGISV
jgi:predicted RNase H-like HicB family nuclease